MRWALLLLVLAGCSDRDGIGASERGRLLAMRPVWIAAARAERCPRPALRTPTTGDGSAYFEMLRDKSSPARQCLARIQQLRPELGPCIPKMQCGPMTLAAVQPHPDLVEPCAPLFATIEAVAHASEACPTTNSWDDESTLSLTGLGNAVRLEVAPLVTKGQLREASLRVLDAIRFADDYARKSALLGAMASMSAVHRLAETLDELAIDPRLTADEAREIGHDLDMLLASSPRWDAIMRQEQAGTADRVATEAGDMVPTLAMIEARGRGIHRVCSGSLRSCVEHLEEVKVDGAPVFKEGAQRLGMRDAILAFVRMQIELRLASPEDCAHPDRRRALLQPWADRVDVGDGVEPIVTPPAWQRDPSMPPRPVPRTLRCVPATM